MFALLKGAQGGGCYVRAKADQSSNIEGNGSRCQTALHQTGARVSMPPFRLLARRLESTQLKGNLTNITIHHVTNSG